MKQHFFVICAYKESPYLESCITSLLVQDDPSKAVSKESDEEGHEKSAGLRENILISTSTPNEWISGLAEKYRIPLKVHTKTGVHPGAGIASDWNAALAAGRAAGADYITLAHQDDVYESGYRDTVCCAISEAEGNGENPQIVFTDYYEIRERRVSGESENLKCRRVKKTGTESKASETAEKSNINGTVSDLSNSPIGTKAQGEALETICEEKCEQNENLSIKRRLLAPLKSPRFRRTRFGKRCAIRFGNGICCPAVTYVCRNIPENPFQENMGSNIDWQLWEELSRRPGSFVYIPEMLMGHRIHEGSTTSELIQDSRRGEEDLYMLRKFWPGWVAGMIEHSYKSAEKSNQV